MRWATPLDAQLIVALTGVLALLLGQLANRRGAIDSRAQQLAAQRLAERQQDWRERGELLRDEQEAHERTQQRLADMERRAQASEQQLADHLAALPAHEIWDTQRTLECPAAPPPPPLRIPRQRPGID